MKNLLILLWSVGLLSCSESADKNSEPFPNFLHPDVSVITYEGILRSVNGKDVLVQLDLVPGAPGMDSYYKLYQHLFPDDTTKHFSAGGNHEGKYSVLLGAPGERLIEMTTGRKKWFLMQTDRYTADDWLPDHLVLKSDGDHALVMVDEDFKEVEPRYTLFRRSDLFTVEGYFTAYKDTCDFFERNTRKQWAVAQLAKYPYVKKTYNRLSKEKFEGIYVKALSYSVRQTGPSGEELDALVFKKILLMDSTDGKYHP